MSATAATVSPSAHAEVLLARQPIFDADLKVPGY